MHKPVYIMTNMHKKKKAILQNKKPNTKKCARVCLRLNNKKKLLFIEWKLMFSLQVHIPWMGTGFVCTDKTQPPSGSQEL